MCDAAYMIYKRNTDPFECKLHSYNFKNFKIYLFHNFISFRNHIIGIKNVFHIICYYFLRFLLKTSYKGRYGDIST